jgi:glutathione S-transferase
MANAASAVTLHYLPVRAKGEHLRMLLHAAGVPFEYQEYGFADGAWPAQKAAHAFPFDRLPALTFTDAAGAAHMLPESGAIARLLARWAGLHPEDAVAAAHCDALYDASADLDAVDPIYNGFHTDAAANEPKFEMMARRLACLEERLAGRDYFGGAGPVAADFVLFCCVDNLVALRGQVLGSLPQLASWFPRMRALPAVQAVLTSRADIRPPAGNK